MYVLGATSGMEESKQASCPHWARTERVMGSESGEEWEHDQRARALLVKRSIPGPIEESITKNV
ncbi:hypothetical protein KSF_103400 [Reticulibacter mediterranei]|uniref:Uncharacterized protein n=1 Tax=Reticulibacter mediterranei TaxID=2778369 RepID=A0A8J3NAE4_9CHLR|nr:hypothetical protein KSF_103400 [Reticulibacter mediterranei]